PRRLIGGKFWGILGAARPYLIAYAVPAVALSALCGLGALFWTVLWLAVTWLAIAFTGAAGLWCSVRSSTSWRSLLATLGWTYVGGFVASSALAPFILMRGIMLGVVLSVLASGGALGMGMGGIGMVMQGVRFITCAALAGGFLLFAWRFLVAAEYRVGVLERTKHWRYEPEDFHRPRVRG